eukprot:955947_1
MSSDNYAGRLSKYPNKGVCGLPELTESKRSLENKISKMISLIKSSKYVVILTGAGVSTEAGIPDFRGPNGIWTIENKGKKKVGGKRKRTKSSSSVEVAGATQAKVKEKEANSSPKPSASFETARPTLTHRAITKLASDDIDIVKYVITQNVDGLHMRSGLPRSKHCFLHGCIFTEKCEICSKEYFRKYDIGGVSFKKTGRQCTATKREKGKASSCTDTCGGDLRDTILDWEDELPQDDWESAQDECAKSDLVLALGTSLRIEPAGSLPTLGKKFVIVNKQVTPYDTQASLIVRAPVDDVLSRVMETIIGEEWETRV